MSSVVEFMFDLFFSLLPGRVIAGLLALFVALALVVMVAGQPAPMPGAECCDDACNFSSSIGCPVGPVPPRKGRRTS